MVIQNNIPGLNSKRIYNKNSSKLAKSLEKLSSGYSINRAADDSAGLAVSEKMRSQIFGMKQSVKNCADGISLIQTFEGALGETVAIIKRMKSLADQIANGTYDNVDRNAVEIEYCSLKEEVDHIADTDFNGIVMLNGGRMSDKFTVVGEKGTSWIFPETICWDSYESSVKAENYDMKIQLMPGVAEAAADKHTFELLAQLDKAGVTANIKNGVPEFYFSGEIPSGFKIETIENEGIISFTNPTSGIVEVAKVSVPAFEHNASSTANGAWVRSTWASDVRGSFTYTFNDQNLYYPHYSSLDNYETYRPSQIKNCEYLYSNFKSMAATVEEDVNYTNINGIVTKAGDNNIARRGALIGNNGDSKIYANASYDRKIKPGSTLTFQMNKSSLNYGYGYIDGSNTRYTLSRVNEDFNNAMYIKYGTAQQTFTYKDINGIAEGDTGYDPKWYDRNDNEIDLSASGLSLTVDIDGVDTPVTRVNFTAKLPYTYTTNFDGYYFDNRINNDFSMGEYDEKNPELGGIDYRIADDKAVYTYVNDGLNSSNPDTVGYWVDKDNNRVNLERMGVHLPKDLSDASDILHSGMTIKVSNPLAGATGKITGGIQLWDSHTNAFRVAYENLTYSDSLILQAGARSKDSVNFTFAYSSNGIGGLNADLNCTAKGLGLDKLTLATQEKANFAIDRLDYALNKVSMIRATFGAAQNRLEHKIDNLNNTTENLTSAESRIRDTDMAKEMMNFTKQQILTQSSQSMLAQANSLPQQVMSLISS